MTRGLSCKKNFNESNTQILSATDQLVAFIGSMNKTIEYIEEFGQKIDQVVELTKKDLDLNITVQESIKSLSGESHLMLNAIGEQKMALEEIAKSIAVINISTQEIASGSEELTGNSHQIADMALKLASMGDQFDNIDSDQDEE